MNVTKTGAAVAHELNTENLIKLTQRDIGAIHVKNFYPSEIVNSVVQKVVNHQSLGHYHKRLTSSVNRLHMPYIDTRWDMQLINEYHDAALPSIYEVRSMFYPYLCPIDHIRLLLEELWPSGANLLRLRGQPCFVGAFRVFQPTTSEFYPHNDRIDQETDAPEIAGLTEQLVANVYLQVADEGGDLHLWLRDPTEQEKQTIVEVEGLEPDSIEPPALTFCPKAGDLIIFSSAMLHAVTPAVGRHRVAMASFIGCKTIDEPLFYWS